MLTYRIPGREILEIETLILDLNGTIAIDGETIEGVKERLQELRDKNIQIILFTGNTHNNAEAIAQNLGIEFVVTKNAEEKASEAKKFNIKKTATIGNGNIDVELFKAVELSIVVLQKEGTHRDAILAADVLVPSILDALDLFLFEQRLVATLRK